jgi:methylamine dehydrogenase accessory protein MauD
MLDALAFFARYLLVGTFLLAGVTKLLDLAGSRTALEGFGLPSWMSRPGAVFLPIAELLVAAALLLPSTFVWGALGAIGLLVLFVVGAAVNLALGRTPDCHCFGQLHSAPIGPGIILRNGALAVLAAIVAWRGDAATLGGISDWSRGLTSSEQIVMIALAVLIGLVAVQAFFGYQLFRQNGRILLRLNALEEGFETPAEVRSDAPTASGLPVGTQAPEFALSGIHGETLTLAALRAEGKPVMLLFTDPGCGPCNALMPEVGRWQRERKNDLNVVVLSRKSAEENRKKAAQHQLTRVLLQNDAEVAEAYRYQGTPSAVLVSPDGKIASNLVAGAEGIRTLVADDVPVGTASSQPSPPQPVPAAVPQEPATQPSNLNGNGAKTLVGHPAPDLQLPDLAGKPFSLEERRGRNTLVLFWNPQCGFCQKMMGDLKAWEDDKPPTAPDILVVSRGSVEDNVAQGIRSKIVLDEEFAVASSFGASGTPMAVMVDAEGMIASPLVAGAPAVMELAKPI